MKTGAFLLEDDMPDGDPPQPVLLNMLLCRRSLINDDLLWCGCWMITATTGSDAAKRKRARALQPSQLL